MGVEVFSYVVSIGDAADGRRRSDGRRARLQASSISNCPRRAAPTRKRPERMKAAIDAARKAGESLGGTFRVVATGLVPGIGGIRDGGRAPHLAHRARRSSPFPRSKASSSALGFEAARRPGSQVHDPITLDREHGFMRESNNAGGLEGGMSTGMPLIVTAADEAYPDAHESRCPR